jgi:hypothetical protein
MANGTTRHICLLRGAISPLPAEVREAILQSG